MARVVDFESSVLRHLFLCASDAEIRETFSSVHIQKFCAALVVVQERCAPHGSVAVSRVGTVLNADELNRVTRFMCDLTGRGRTGSEEASPACFAVIEALINAMAGPRKSLLH